MFAVLSRLKDSKHEGLSVMSKMRLYNKEDVEKTMDCFCGHEYEETFEAAEEIRGRFIDAGHVLGSGQMHRKEEKHPCDPGGPEIA